MKGCPRKMENGDAASDQKGMKSHFVFGLMKGEDMP